MLRKLKDSEKFKKEINFYKSNIEHISNETVKKSAIVMLNQLISHCQLIDEAHSSSNNGNIDPRRVRDNAEKMIQIRLDLNKLIKDLDNA